MVIFSEHQEEVSFILFNTGAIVLLHRAWYFREKYFLIGMGQQTQDFKGQTGTLEICPSVFIRNCAFHLSSWRVQGSSLPQQDLVWLRDTQRVPETEPHLWWDAVELSVTQMGRLILGAVKLVLFVSARRSCEPPLMCVHDAQAPALPGCDNQVPGLKGTSSFEEEISL